MAGLRKGAFTPHVIWWGTAARRWHQMTGRVKGQSGAHQDPGHDITHNARNGRAQRRNNT